MRRWAAGWLAVALFVVATACTRRDGPTTTLVYVGAITTTTDLLAISLEGARVQAFLADGEPGGDAEWFEGLAKDGRFDLRSDSGQARIEGTAGPAQAGGTVTLADGQARPFRTLPARDGAGLYDVTVTADGRYTGRSTGGTKLDGQASGDMVEGLLTLNSGRRIKFDNADLSRAFQYPTPGGQAGRYRVVVSRFGASQVGRGLTSGKPDSRIIALDLAASGAPTPGIYVGRASMSLHRFVVSVDPADTQGQRRLRMLLSDGLPNGDIEWFAGPTRNGQIELTSASSQARITGAFTDADVRGTVTLVNGQQRRFFGVPAGDGAGIYELDVSVDRRIAGTSEKYERLDARQDGAVVTGTITSPGGDSTEVQASDLAGGVGGGPQPDRYLAFASSGGRTIIGRSGDVRGGRPGPNTLSFG